MAYIIRRADGTVAGFSSQDAPPSRLPAGLTAVRVDRLPSNIEHDDRVTDRGVVTKVLFTPSATQRRAERVASLKAGIQRQHEVASITGDALVLRIVEANARAAAVDANVDNATRHRAIAGMVEHDPRDLFYLITRSLWNDYYPARNPWNLTQYYQMFDGENTEGSRSGQRVPGMTLVQGVWNMVFWYRT